MIWELTLEPRGINLVADVEIAQLSPVDHQDFSISNVVFATGKDSDLPPAVLSVCRESRMHLLPRYPRILQGEIKGSVKLRQSAFDYILWHDGYHFRNGVESRRGAMVNFDFDTIVLLLEGRNAETHKLISPLNLLGKVGTKHEIEKIKRLKFGSELWKWAEEDVDFMEALGAFKGLEEICVVARGECSVCEEDHYGSEEENKNRIEEILSEVGQEAEGWKMPEIKATMSWERE